MFPRALALDDISFLFFTVLSRICAFLPSLGDAFHSFIIKFCFRATRTAPPLPRQFLYSGISIAKYLRIFSFGLFKEDSVIIKLSGDPTSAQANYVVPLKIFIHWKPCTLGWKIKRKTPKQPSRCNKRNMHGPE